MQQMNVGLVWSGLALVIVGLVTTSWAVTELSEGVQELGRHWWSALATLPLFAGIAMTAIGLVRSRDRQGAGN